MTVETKPEAAARERAIHELAHSTLNVVSTDATSALVLLDGREFTIEVYVADVTGWRDET